MRRGVLPIVVVLMVAAACSSFDADESSTPAPDGGTSSSGGVNDGGSNEGGFVLPEAGPCVGDCPPVTIGSFKAYDAFGIGVSDAHVAWYFQSENQQAKLQWCTKSDGACNGANSYPGVGSSIVGAPEAVYAAVTGGASGRIVRLGRTGLQEIIKADLSDPDAAKFDSPSYLFAGPAGLDFYDYSGLPSAIGVFRLDRDAGLPTPQKLGSLDTANAHRWQRLETVGPNMFLFEYFGIARVTPGGEPADYCPYDGGCSVGVLDMTSDGASIVWIDDQQVQSCPVGEACSGLKITVTTQSSFPERPRKLTFFDGRLYITTFPGGADGTSKIYACKIGDCTSPQTPIATDAYLPRGVVVTSDAIYWLATAGAYDGKTPVDFRVVRKPR